MKELIAKEVLDYLESLVDEYYQEHKELNMQLMRRPTCDVADVYEWIDETREKFSIAPK